MLVKLVILTVGHPIEILFPNISLKNYKNKFNEKNKVLPLRNAGMEAGNGRCRMCASLFEDSSARGMEPFWSF